MNLILEFIRPFGWGPLLAMLFLNGAFCYRFGGRVLFLSIPIVSAGYAVTDAKWIRSAMAQPGWDGQPDQDAVFFLGMFARVFVAGILLLASFVTAILLSNYIHARKHRHVN
ncbi:hypothetical protein [Rhodopirellula europaea]|uniref:hypothetical protein n=1 Tax=Rhodopirellula europaea TaxID=1263866 RepID=UPI003D2E8934